MAFYAHKFWQKVYVISIGVYYTNTKHFISPPHNFKWTSYPVSKYCKNLAITKWPLWVQLQLYTDIMSFFKPFFKLVYRIAQKHKFLSDYRWVCSQGLNCVLTWHMTCAQQNKSRNGKWASAFQKQNVNVYEFDSVWCLCVNALWKGIAYSNQRSICCES